MKAEEIQKFLDETMNGKPYLFACADPETNQVTLIRAGDLGISATLQMYIASQILNEMQNTRPPERTLTDPPQESISLKDLLNRPAQDLS